jgi:glutamyl-tRNA reductase
VLVLGAGENARLCIEHLLARRCRPLLIANRTASRAEELAQEYGGETVSLERLDDALTRADIVVSTTGSPDPIVDAALVRPVMARRSDRAMIFVDIAVPRDIAPDVDDIRNVFRFDMDALQDIVDQNLNRRQKEVAAVEDLVENETQNFLRWWQGLAASPIIRDLHESFERVRRAEIEKHGKRFRSDDHEQLEMFSRNLVRKLLMGVTTEIKGYRPENPREGERLSALRHLFRLPGRGRGRRR